VILVFGSINKRRDVGRAIIMVVKRVWGLEMISPVMLRWCRAVDLLGDELVEREAKRLP